MQVSQKPRIGWIGTGVMGNAMAKRLFQSGYSLSVFNRSRSKALPLIELGASWCDSPAEVAQNTDVVFLMVGYPSDVRQVVLGTNGILAGWRQIKPEGVERVLVDMTTSSPQLAREIWRILADDGIEGLDAPVSGGDVGAKNGTLSIMIGGKKEVADRLRPLFDCLGENVVWQGEAGSGQHAKMVNQILIAGNMIGVCEALLYAFQAGLDIESVFTSVATGAAGSWSLSRLGTKIIQGDFEPGFYIEHFIKDMGIALEEAKRMDLALPGLALVHQLYLATAAQGNARLGTQALIRGLAAMSGCRLPLSSPKEI